MKEVTSERLDHPFRIPPQTRATVSIIRTPIEGDVPVVLLMKLSSSVSPDFLLRAMMRSRIDTSELKLENGELFLRMNAKIQFKSGNNIVVNVKHEPLYETTTPIPTRPSPPTYSPHHDLILSIIVIVIIIIGCLTLMIRRWISVRKQSSLEATSVNQQSDKH